MSYNPGEQDAKEVQILYQKPFKKMHISLVGTQSIPAKQRLEILLKRRLCVRVADVGSPLQPACHRFIGHPQNNHLSISLKFSFAFIM